MNSGFIKVAISAINVLCTKRINGEKTNMFI